MRRVMQQQILGANGFAGAKAWALDLGAFYRVKT